MNNIVIILGVVIAVATGIPVLIQLLRNHPKGLFILFFAEMWERFSYYGMRGLLVFYLTQHFLFDDKFSANQYGSYTSLVYLLPLIGGIVADRWLGTRKSVAFGAVLLTIGQLAMAITPPAATQTLTYQGHQYELRAEGRGANREARLIVDAKPYQFKQSPEGGLAVENLPAGAGLPSVLPKGSYQMNEQRDPKGVNLLYLSLALIIMGVGFLKPNISTIVGQLYPERDPRRDAGFTLYYYGVNFGAFWAAVLCGYLGQNVSWSAGFGLAGFGMALGWIVFMLGRGWLQGKGEPPHPETLKAPFIGPLNREWLIYILGLLGTAVVFYLIQNHDWVGGALIGSILLSIAAIVYIIAIVCKTWEQRQRMMLAVVLIVGAVVFFTLFEQAGSSLNLFADRNVNLSLNSAPAIYNILGQDVIFATAKQLEAAGPIAGKLWIDTGLTASQTQSFNAGFILLLAPLFAAMWAWLAKRRLDPNPTLKFGLGLVQVGAGFMVVVLGAGMADADFRVPLMLLGALYLFHTTGELFLSPVGLSQITKLSLPSVVSFMMAVWFLASSIAQFVGGYIASLAGTETVGGQVLDPAAALHTSVHIFNLLGLWGMGIGVGFIVLSFFIKHWAHGADETDDIAAPMIAPTPDGER